MLLTNKVVWLTNLQGGNYMVTTTLLATLSSQADDELTNWLQVVLTTHIVDWLIGLDYPQVD